MGGRTKAKLDAYVELHRMTPVSCQGKHTESSYHAIQQQDQKNCLAGDRRVDSRKSAIVAADVRRLTLKKTNGTEPQDS